MQPYPQAFNVSVICVFLLHTSHGYLYYHAFHHRVFFFMNDSVAALGSVIQIAVTPVFLLAGIAGFLNVMSARLGRIVDRARVVERRVSRLQEPDQLATASRENKMLWRRIRLINRCIGLCASSALLVCCVVVGLFVGDFWQLDIGAAIVTVFVLALCLLIISLLLFVREVQLATRTLVMGMEVGD